MDDRLLANVDKVDNNLIERFKGYGMESVMFFYVLIYKSVLIAIICAFFFAFYLIFRVLLLCFPKSRVLYVIKEFFSHGLVFNIPF